jgi:hypothetical protein
MPTPSQTPTPSERQPYRLRLPHTHAGSEHPAGTELLLDSDQIERVKAAEDAALAHARKQMTQEAPDA